MSTTATDNFVLNKATAVEFLINGSSGGILLNGLSWKDYERFLEDFEEKSGWRLAYDKGKLEIMPPTYEHEFNSFLFGYFISAYCEEFELEFVGAGSTTLKNKIAEKGIEPDECFYIQSAAKVIGKTFKSKDYPMPDIAVEIDITTDSIDKLPIYSALKVPEVWIYDGKKITFNKLVGRNYHQTLQSIALPLLSSEKLTGFLKLSREKGQTFALKNLRKHLNELKTS